MKKEFIEIFYKEKILTKIKKENFLKNGPIPIISQEKKLINGYTYGKYLKNKDCILVGDHTLVLKYINFEFVTGGDGVILLKSNIDLLFSYYLLYKNIPKTEGYKRHFTILKNLKFKIPKIEEQNVISEFLSSIDILIEKQEEYLKNLKQNHKYYLSCSYGSDNYISIENFLIKNTLKNKNNNINNIQSISNKKGFIAQSDQFEDRIVASNDTSNYYIVRNGVIAYNPSRINVGSIALKNDATPGIISPLYVSFYVKETADKNFIFNFFKTNKFKKQMYSLFEGSVRNTLSWESLKRIKIPDLPLEKQIFVTNLLSSMDNLINKLMLMFYYIIYKGLSQKGKYEKYK